MKNIEQEYLTNYTNLIANFDITDYVSLADQSHCVEFSYKPYAGYKIITLTPFNNDEYYHIEITNSEFGTYIVKFYNKNKFFASFIITGHCMNLFYQWLEDHLGGAIHIVSGGLLDYLTGKPEDGRVIDGELYLTPQQTVDKITLTFDLNNNITV